MAQGQDIVKVFVAKKFIKTAGKKLSDLADDGDFGIFDLNTNLTAADFTPKRTYLAIKMGGKIHKSPNMWIENDNVKSISKVVRAEHQDKIVTFKDFTITCGKDYTLRIETHNEFLKFKQGTNSLITTLTARSEECNTCGTADPCKKINPIPVVLEFLVNASGNPYIKTEVTTRKALTNVAGLTKTAGDVLTLDELKTLNKYNKGLTGATPAYVEVDLKFTAIPLEKTDWKDGYMSPRNTEFVVGIGDGFIGNGTVEVTKPNIVEQGSGFDLKNVEWTTINEKYNTRYSEFTRKEFNPESFVDETKVYDVITIRYGVKSQVTHHLYDHTSEVIIATESLTSGDFGDFATAVSKIDADSKIGF